MGPFCELFDLEWEIAGDRRPEHARESAASRDALRRQVHLVTSITGALYNFLRTSVSIDEANECLEVVYANAAAFSEPLRLSTEGFMNQLNLRQGSARRWTSERRSASEVVFRLGLPERLARS